MRCRVATKLKHTTAAVRSQNSVKLHHCTVRKIYYFFETDCKVMLNFFRHFLAEYRLSHD